MTFCHVRSSPKWDDDFIGRQLAAFDVHVANFLKSLDPARQLQVTDITDKEFYPHLADDSSLNQMADKRGHFLAVRLSIRDSESSDSTGWCCHGCFRLCPKKDSRGVDKRSYVPSYTIHRFDSMISYRNWFKNEVCYNCLRYLARGVCDITSIDIFPVCKHNVQEVEKPCFIPDFLNTFFLQNISHY